MIKEPEQECEHLAKQLILACPEDIKKLLEKCYIVVYDELIMGERYLLATCFVPNNLLNEFKKHRLTIKETALRMEISLCGGSIGEWLQIPKNKILLKDWQTSRPKHYLNLLHLLDK